VVRYGALQSTAATQQQHHKAVCCHGANRGTLERIEASTCIYKTYLASAAASKRSDATPYTSESRRDVIGGDETSTGRGERC